MVKLIRFDGEKNLEFPDRNLARIFLLGKMVIYYINMLSEETLEKLARRAGYDIVEELNENKN